jgi:hypothetical protein
MARRGMASHDRNSETLTALTNIEFDESLWIRSMPANDMRCANCHRKEATVQFTPVVDGKPQKTVHLCEDCAPDLRAIEAFYWRVTSEKFARLQSDARAAESFFSAGPEELERIAEELENPLAAEQEQEGDVSFLLIGTTWHALHFLLTGDSELKPDPLPPPPLGNVVLGGTETLWPCRYGQVRSLTPDEIRAAADALSHISLGELRARFSVASFNAAQIYPRGKGARWTAEAAESVFEIYPLVVEFFRSAACAGDMVLLSLD